VQSGAWRPEDDADDRQRRDALAARGYWQAYQAVRSALGDILQGEDPAKLFREAHRTWYFQMFEPFVAAGAYPAAVLADYRNHPVYLRGSRYVPPRADLVAEGMEALAALLEQEESPGVRAVAGHWLFGYVHPYPDGNGRLARFLMNVMLASGGYRWTTIQVGDRKSYMNALDTASLAGDVTPFAELVAGYLKSPDR
jgi:Fic family protein